MTDRAVAALYGLAIGDALGMPTQLMSRKAVRESFGRIDGFRAAGDDHPIAAGLPAGSVTDDTEQALLLAELLIENDGRVPAGEFARRLIAWEDRMRARGSLDLLGPSTKAAVSAVLSGVPAERAGATGSTNGAAMRITPVGIAVASGDLERLIDRVVEANLVTHNTGVAIAGAAAVAAAVSAGLAAEPAEVILAHGIEAARLGSARGNWVAGGDVAARITWAVALADPDDPESSLDALYRLIGTSLATQESVPMAFGILSTFPDDPWAACCAAASLGGDSDTIAALIGAMGGARLGLSAFPADAVAAVREVNHLDLESVGERLAALR